MAVRRPFSMLAWPAASGSPYLDSNGCEVIVSEETLRIELDRLLIPHSRFVKVPLSKRDVSHGFMCGDIGGVVVQHCLEQGPGVACTLLVCQEVGTHGVGLGLGQGSNREGRVIHIGGPRHLLQTEIAVIFK